MCVFNNIRIKLFIFSLFITGIYICPIYSKDLDVIAINYSLSSDKITCQLLVKNISNNSLYILSPDSYSYQKLDNYKILKIQSFSDEQLRGNFSFNEDNLNHDNPEIDYTYSFYSEVKKNQKLVIFFDIELCNLPFNDSRIINFLDYKKIKIQYLYSHCPFEEQNSSFFVSEVPIISKIKEKKEFNIFEYIENWDDSVIFIKSNK